jgi:hypothetical protein
MNHSFLFVVNGFNNRAFSEKYFISHAHQPVFHIVFDTRNQVQPILKKQFTQGSPVIDHQMEFEAIEPAHRAFANCCDILENTVAFDPFVFANGIITFRSSSTKRL